MSKTALSAANFIWRWRFPSAGLCLLVSVLAASQLSSLAVSNSLEIWYPQDDPELLNYRRFQENYGSDEIDPKTLDIRAAEVSQDGKIVRLRVDGLRPIYVHELHAPGVRSRSGKPLLHDSAYYTLNRLPR